jgi:hypothetical protein
MKGEKKGEDLVMAIRSKYFVAGVVCGGLLVVLASTDTYAADLNHGRTVYGLFGERVLGRPLAPQSRSYFERGVQRSASGIIVGVGPHSRFHYTPAVPEPEMIREPRPAVIVPDQGLVVQPVRPRPRVDPGVPPAVERPRPGRQPAAGQDIWFRSRVPAR